MESNAGQQQWYFALFATLKVLPRALANLRAIAAA